MLKRTLVHIDRVQDAAHRPYRTTKRILYVAVAFAGLTMWSYYSGITVVCSCIEGAVCDCTVFAFEVAKTAGIVLTGIGIGLFVLSFLKGRPRMVSWV